MKYDKRVNSVKRYTLLNCNIYNFCADFVNIVKIVVAHYTDVNFMALNLLSIQYHYGPARAGPLYEIRI